MSIVEKVEALIARAASSELEEARTSAFLACKLIREHNLKIVPPPTADAAEPFKKWTRQRGVPVSHVWTDDFSSAFQDIFGGRVQPTPQPAPPSPIQEEEGRTEAARERVHGLAHSADARLDAVQQALWVGIDSTMKVPDVELWRFCHPIKTPWFRPKFLRKGPLRIVLGRISIRCAFCGEFLAPGAEAIAAPPLPYFVHPRCAEEISKIEQAGESG